MITKHLCNVSRYSAVGTNGRKTQTRIASSVPCTFIPMSPKAAISNEYSVGFAWDIYFNPGADVRSGDRLTWNGRNYTVGGSMPYSGFGPVDHVHVTAESERPNGQ